MAASKFNATIRRNKKQKTNTGAAKRYTSIIRGKKLDPKSKITAAEQIDIKIIKVLEDWEYAFNFAEVYKAGADIAAEITKLSYEDLTESEDIIEKYIEKKRASVREFLDIQQDRIHFKLNKLQNKNNKKLADLNNIQELFAASRDRYVESDYKAYLDMMTDITDLYYKKQAIVKKESNKQRRGNIGKGLGLGLGAILAGPGGMALAAGLMEAPGQIKKFNESWGKKTTSQKMLTGAGLSLKALGLVLGAGTSAGSLLGGQLLQDKAKRSAEKDERLRLLNKRLSAVVKNTVIKHSNKKNTVNRFDNKLDQIKAAGGLNGIVNKATRLTVGEAGPEFVMAVPLHGKSGAKTTLNGNVLKAAGGFMGTIGKALGGKKDNSAKVLESIDYRMQGLEKNSKSTDNNIALLTKTITKASEKEGNVFSSKQDTGSLLEKIPTDINVDKSKVGGALSKIAKSPAMKVGGSAIAGLTAAYAGYNDEEIANQSKGTKLGVAATAGIGGAGGAYGGMLAGAAIGSVVPIIGTAIGAILGGILGGAAGGYLGKEGGKAILANDKIPSFAEGGAFTTSGEQLIRVGEAGPENVVITPAGGNNISPFSSAALKPTQVVIKDDQSKLGKEQLKELKNKDRKGEDEETPQYKSLWDKIFNPNKETSVDSKYKVTSSGKPFSSGSSGGGSSPPGGGGGGGSTSSGSEVGFGETGSTSEAMAFFTSQAGGGWSTAQAAGIVGNLQVESPNLKTNALGDNGNAYGIGQWWPDRQANFQREFGKPIQQSNFKEQLAFVNWELNNSHAAAGKLLRAETAADRAAVTVDKKYEISSGIHRQKRIANALALMGGTNVTSKSSYSAGQGAPTTIEGAVSAISSDNKKGAGIKDAFDNALLSGQSGHGDSTVNNNTNVVNGGGQSAAPINMTLSSRLNSSVAKMTGQMQYRG